MTARHTLAGQAYTRERARRMLVYLLPQYSAYLTFRTDVHIMTQSLNIRLFVCSLFLSQAGAVALSSSVAARHMLLLTISLPCSNRTIALPGSLPESLEFQMKRVLGHLVGVPAAVPKATSTSDE